MAAKKSISDVIEEVLGVAGGASSLPPDYQSPVIDWTQIGGVDDAVTQTKDAIYAEIERIIVTGDNPHEREHLHLSDVLSKNFCYRKCTFAACAYPTNPVTMSPDRIKTNAQGWGLHKRWQTWAANAGVSKGAEIERSHKGWFLVFTPDDIWQLSDGITRVLEIKGYDHTEVARILRSGKAPHDALVQVNCYCYLLGYPNWMILVESKGKIIDEASSKLETENKGKLALKFRKGTQEVFVWEGTLDTDLVKPYIVKLNTIKRMVEIHLAQGKLHPGICTSKDDYAARECCYSTVCFMSDIERAFRRAAATRNQ